MIRSKTVLKAALLAAVSLSPFAAGAAFAADAAPADSATPAATQVSEVIVTVQKREQKQIDVPIALTTLTGQDLAKLGLYDLHDASVYVPGVYVQNQSVNDVGIVIRGVTTDDLSPTLDSRISIYQDGVDISRLGGAYTELFDMQRLEVAKGPQTTLFGRSALIGAFSEIENKPVIGDYDWNVHVEGGNYDYALVQAMVNIPIDDEFAARIAIDHRSREGYIPDVLGGRALDSLDSDAARLGLTWKPTNDFSDNLIVNYEMDRPSAVSFKSKTFDPANPTTGQVLGNTSPFTGAALAGSIDGKSLGITREVGGVTNLADWKLNDAWSLHSITAFRKFDGEEVFDPDGFSFPFLTGGSDEWQHQYSQDLRLNWNPGGQFSAFVGASYFDEHAEYRIPLEFDERVALATLTGVLNRTSPVTGPLAAYTNPALMAAELQGVAFQKFGYILSPTLAQGIANNLGMHEEESTEGIDNKAADVYGDFNWKPTDRLELDFGLRYSSEQKSTQFSSQEDGSRSILGGFLGASEEPAAIRNQLLGALAVPGAATIPESAAFPLPMFGLQDQPTGAPGGSSLTDNGLTWRVNAKYDVAPSQNVYISYARGRLPATLSAGPPAVPGGAAVFTEAQAETLDSYEAGYKGLLLDRHLDLEGSVYYYKYNHFQTQVLVGTNFVTEDAGAATTYGFEGQAAWRFNELVDAFATYAYTHGRFDNGAYKGNQFRLTPENALSVGMTARYPALNGMFDITPSYVWRSKVFFDDTDANPALQAGQLIEPLVFDEFQKAYGLLNVRAGYAPTQGNWRVEAFVTNATNTKYLKDAGNTGEDLGLPTYIAGEPRMFGLSFTLRH